MVQPWYDRNVTSDYREETRRYLVVCKDNIRKI